MSTATPHPHSVYLKKLYTTPLFRRTIHQNVAAALCEDLGVGDIHECLFPANQLSRGQVISRETATMCGARWVETTFAQISDNVHLEWHCLDGEQVKPDQKIVSIQGPTTALLAGERTALNFLQLLMATATQYTQLQSMIKDTSTKILDTRKTIPGLRLAQKYAIACAGGTNHRIGLWDSFLIKENHIMAAGGIKEAVAQAKTHRPGLFLEVEVENLEELEEALTARVDRVLLDNFTPEALQKAVTMRAALAKGIALEASGNVDETTILTIANTGVDFISVGGITKNIKAIDLSFRIDSH